MVLADTNPKGSSSGLLSQTAEYMKSIGYGSLFADERGKLGIALDERTMIESKMARNGAKIFDMIAGVYPLNIGSVVSMEEARTMPRKVAGALSVIVEKENAILAEKHETMKRDSNIPAHVLKRPPKLFVKPDDADYIYMTDSQGREKVFKKIGKVLESESTPEVLKTYREWKSKVKSYSVPDINLVISTNPADIIRKSSTQSWEDKSCERLTSQQSRGVWDDIRFNNAIAYVTVDGNPAWMGRVMLRWCINDSKEVDLGIESIFYGNTAYEDVVLKKIKEIAEKKGLLNYHSCETPYVYHGWSDQMHGQDKKIVYGDRGVTLEKEIEEIVSDWRGRSGYISFYGDELRDRDLDNRYSYTEDLGDFIQWAFNDFWSYLEELEAIPSNWEEDILRGSPEALDLKPESLRELIRTGDFDRPSSDQEFALWWNYSKDETQHNLLKKFFSLLRKYKLQDVLFVKNKDAHMTTKYYGDPSDRQIPYSGERRWEARGQFLIRSGFYDMTQGVPDDCLKSDTCDVFKNMAPLVEETILVKELKWPGQEEAEVEKTVQTLNGAPFHYDTNAFFDMYAQNIVKFVQCVDWVSKTERLQHSEEEIAEEETAKECFQEHLAEIGTIGELLPIQEKGDVAAFIKEHPDLDYDEMCASPSFRKAAHYIAEICEIARPIEKFFV